MVKKLICTVLTFTLVFCTAAMFPSTASAGPGDPSSFSMAIGSNTFSGGISFNSSKTGSSAYSSYSIMAGLTVKITMCYQYRYGGVIHTEYAYGFGSNSATSVTTSAQRDSGHTNQYDPFYAEGVHSYSGYGGSQTRTTRVDA